MTAARILRALAVGMGLATATASLTWGLLFYRPLPTIDGHYRFLGLHERGEVVRDVHGIPRIYTRDLHDLFFLQGYVTAQDRLAQMQAMRAAARSELSPELERSLDRRIPALHDALDAYADGVNKLVSQHSEARALPGDLVLAGRRPEPWRPIDSLAIVAAYVERTPRTSVCASAPPGATLKGRPMFAADLYTDAPAPGFYEIGLDGGGVRAVGASLPGVPAVVGGHNAWIAWATMSSAGPGTDPASTLHDLVRAMAARDAGQMAETFRGGAVATCIADLAGRSAAADRDEVAVLPPDRPAVIGGAGGRGAAIREKLEQARGIDLEAMRALLGRPVARVGARILVDLADVDTSRSAVSHGASAHRASPHFDDQAPLWELGQAHRLPFTRGAIGRTDGELVLRAR
ncbi:MAG: penicillin acylase family protein [Chloroflexi bacterium]|nr:penicillin acylase family protein [Chloroflexota bacterium]